MLKQTPLADIHSSMGGKMVDFGGWFMPVNYGSQIEEHHKVRTDAGMFDVSHMTIIDIRGEGGEAFLRYLLANDVAKLKEHGKALYSAMLNDQGGVIDDLIVYLMSWGYRLVVNCATREKDLAWINAKAKDYAIEITERDDMSMVAIQGPNARACVASVLLDDVSTLDNLNVFYGAHLSGAREQWFAARTGYTGEDGYEVMLPNSEVGEFWLALAQAGVAPCGLGARDTLRLEAGMNLYGHEMGEQTTPWVANMAWTLSLNSERDFIGRAVLDKQKSAGIQQKLVGLVMRTRGVLRDGYTVKIKGCDEPGVITSGTFSPTLQLSIALARIPAMSLNRETSHESNEAIVVIRGKEVAVEICSPCFVRKGKALVS